MHVDHWISGVALIFPGLVWAKDPRLQWWNTTSLTTPPAQDLKAVPAT